MSTTSTTSNCVMWGGGGVNWIKYLAAILAAATGLSASTSAFAQVEQVPNYWYQCYEVPGPDYSNILPGYMGLLVCDNNEIFMLRGNAKTHTVTLSAETLQAYRAGSPRGSFTQWDDLPVTVGRRADGSVGMVSFSWHWGNLTCQMYMSNGNGNSLNCHG